MKIAALIDANGHVTSFDGSSQVKLFQKEAKSWKVIKELVFGINASMSAAEIRQKISAMVELLEDCRMILASEVTGIPFTILERWGFTIWEAQGDPVGHLDYILENETTQIEAVPEPPSIPTPLPNGREGFYYLDLKTIMETADHDFITSKKILLPFLHNTVFTELEIICEHVPHWFEQEFQRLNLQARVEELRPTRIRVTVTPKAGGGIL